MKLKYKKGDRIGNLEVIKVMPASQSIYRRRRYKCLCICGNTVIRPSDYFRKSKFLSCGCIDPRREIDRENAITKRLYHFKIKSSTIRKRIRDKSTLTFEQFKIIIKKPCFYCGIDYSMIKEDIIRGKKVSEIIVKYNGIDRVDSCLGYVSKNCVPCCSKCNLAKRLMTQKEFFSWIKKVYHFNF